MFWVRFCVWYSVGVDLEELIEKWLDVRDSADDWTERNLASEIVDDLKGLARG